MNSNTKVAGIVEFFNINLRMLLKQAEELSIETCGYYLNNLKMALKDAQNAIIDISRKIESVKEVEDEPQSNTDPTSHFENPSSWYDEDILR